MRRSTAKRRRVRRAGIVVVVALGVLVGLLALAAAAVAALTESFARGERIAAHVTIGGIPVGGMTAAEARSALEAQLAPAARAEVELVYPGGSLRLTREELGARYDLETALSQAQALGRESGLLDRLRTHWRLRQGGVDLPVPVEIDRGRLEAVITGLSPRVNREPRDAKISVDGDNRLHKTPGQSGLVLLVPETVAAVSRALQNGAANRVDLVVKQKPPNISAQDLADLQVVLAAYSTPYHTWQRDRTHNMALAIGKVNGTALKSGESFSLNNTVGERTVQEGYRSAPIFRDGRIVPDTGGGVCQVASTLYNVALLANLQVLERSHHSRPVWYCPAGRDATVYWGQHDLRFRNSLKHTIVILGEIRGDRLWAAIVGHADDDYDVELIRTNYARFGGGSQIIEDPTLPVGKRVVVQDGSAGARATLWIKVSKNGKQIRYEKLHDDYYPPKTHIVRVGVKPKTPPSGTAPPGGAAAPGGASPSGTKPGPGLQPGAKPPGGENGQKPPAANGDKPPAAPGNASPRPGRGAAATRATAAGRTQPPGVRVAER